MSNYQVDREKWASLSICEQMGNIGAEVGRAITATRAGKAARADAAFDRALDLLDATIDVLVDQKSYRLKEILRAREAFVSLYFDDTFEQDASNVERYFMQFAYAARNSTD